MDMTLGGKSCSAVLFDMDGLLINTEDIYTMVTTQILSKYNKTFDWDLKMKMMGLRQLDAAKLLATTLNVDLTPEDYLEIRNQLHLKHFEGCELLQGVEKLVLHLKKNNIPIAVASSSNMEPFEIKTRRHKHVFDLFDIVVLGDDPELKRGKPHEDIFVLAAERLGFKPCDSIIVFEDALSGLDAANRGGFSTIWIPHPEMPKVEHNFNCTKLDSMLCFKPEDFGLPPYEE
eukprot:NODE_102_length_20354_cov_0.272018.p8 type:complete len:231 gc:universal NODE_102_length_20354_cov_0.272018:13214-12522(-)